MKCPPSFQRQQQPDENLAHLQVLLCEAYGVAAASELDKQQAAGAAATTVVEQMAGTYDAKFDPLALVVSPARSASQ